MTHSQSQQLFARAQRSIPGGVNSPVRAFRSVGSDPLFMARGEGAYLWDADRNRYIDYIGSWGPLILGHSYPEVVEAIRKQASIAVSFGAPSELEIELADLVKQFMPSIELIRMVSSGTEATMSAVRLARGFTKREKIIKFEGCYHGHGDSFLIKAGSGALTMGNPSSPGVTEGTARDTLNARYNDLANVQELCAANVGNIAAIIVEPIAGNMGVVPGTPEFLQGLRKLCSDHNIVLIFDEVMTGFRVAPGGAQELYGIRPDLTTLGKIIGGGLPVGAFGGRREIMEMLSPIGPVYQAGTLSGNPLAMAAGIATLSVLMEKNVYRNLEQASAYLASGFDSNLKEAGVPATLSRVGSMLCLFFTDGPVTDYESAVRSDTTMYAKYFRAMLEWGIYLAPSQFEAMFVSTAHTQSDLDATIEAQRASLKPGLR
ncbi:MAG TPA: glutamate-1-semialdehyde 2,1-aminomutase [Candidatus Kapabacteria bacterium]|nr:glutamate-1-semialdehyde 2,1-aminomutase [Candidatus Kapabacteria bacterium]